MCGFYLMCEYQPCYNCFMNSGSNKNTSRPQSARPRIPIPENLRGVVISWVAPETNSREKSGDWYFILWTVALAGMAISFILGNALFGLLLVIAAFVISIYAVQKPANINFAVSRSGVKAGDLLLPFSTLSGFNISEDQDTTYLLLQSKKVYLPLYSFPLSEEVSIDDLREFISLFIEEKEIATPAYQQLMDKIGF